MFIQHNKSIKEFKTWLSTHNIEVYYVLAEPEYIPLDDTLQTQLDALENALSYKGQTNISQHADVPFEIKASALYDLDNLIDRVAVLETA